VSYEEDSSRGSSKGDSREDQVMKIPVEDQAKKTPEGQVLIPVEGRAGKTQEGQVKKILVEGRAKETPESVK
jgi:hypothetical protein